MKKGRIDLVGAGPGDPDLLTIKALRCLENADVVVYDRLVSKEIMGLVPAGATLISVGKAPSNHPVPQEEINDLLIRLARSGRRVVRLKGGDPFIFGRGFEEILELVKEGIEFGVIPGITAAQGCAAALKTPLTHRGMARSVRYITGHCRHDQELDFDWQGLANEDTTLVVYMGHANVCQFRDRLMAHGLSGKIPVLAVNNGTTPDQRHFVSTLERLPDDVSALKFDGPVLFIIGKVAGFCEASSEDIKVVEEETNVVHL